ncbi:MAG TPA: FG-GAP-like repeat-containing protein [Usitatibacter sp.]|nr:FG-GAP-like repeat-containing protein [Usitatibacter sp.]
MKNFRLLFAIAAIAASPAYAQIADIGTAPRLDPSSPLWAPGFQAKSVSTSNAIATGSKLAVRNAYSALYVPAMPAMGFTGNVTSCSPGTISTTFKEWTISRVNYFRAMAALPGNITLNTNSTWENELQSAAVLYSANQRLSHTPATANPPFTVCTTLLTAANNGGSNSNISLAFGTSTFDDVVPRYMDDGDVGNEALGHRRWILYPPQASMSLGSTPTSSTTWGGSALRIFNPVGSRPSTPNGVAWPSAGFVPTQVLPPGNRWSYSYNGADFSTASVTVLANGAPLSITVISDNDIGFGDNMIGWQMPSTPVAGTKYTVTVSGIGGAPFTSHSYTVKPFDATATIPGAGMDFNANGASDVLFANADGRAAIWLMNGTAPASTAQIINAATGWSVVNVADFNGDGKSDLVWQHTDGRMAIYLMNGTAPSSTQQLLNAGTGWSVVQAPDLDGDGKADLLFQNADGSVAAWLMNGTTMTSGTTLMGPGSGWSVIKVADFDGDGNDDLLWKHTDGRHAIWLMNGLAVKQATQILNAGNWTAVQVGDLDGDGKADIVWQNTDGSVAAWLMNGTTMASGSGILGAGTGWSVAKVGDFDGDGRTDILFQHTDGRAAIYLMNGLMPAATQQILNAGGGWSAARILDLNGDGKSDIVWQNTDGTIAVWLMNGTTMSSGSTLLGAASGWSVSTAGH